MQDLFGRRSEERCSTDLGSVSLSMYCVAFNPRVLAFQLQARLNVHKGQKVVLDRFLWSKSGQLRSEAAVLPNGKDVAIGGSDGYLSAFSIRYSSV